MSGTSDTDRLAQGPWAQAIRLIFGLLFVAVGVLAMAWLGSNIRSIPPDMRAAVLRFGTLDRVRGSGLLVAWPRPIEAVILLPSVDRSLALRIDRLDAAMPGQDQTKQALPISTDPRANIAFFLTGDSGVVHLSADVFYRVVDPGAYILARQDLGPLLQRLVIAGMVGTAAGRNLDAILVTGPRGGPSASREQLRGDLLHDVNRRLDGLRSNGMGVGVELTRLDLAAALPSIAKAAFDQVLVATQEADGTIAEARTEAEQWRQGADQGRDKLLDAAGAAGEETVSRAHARTAEISALAHEPGAASVLARVYFERIGPIIAKANRVDTVDAAGAARLILPESGP